MYVPRADIKLLMSNWPHPAVSVYAVLYLLCFGQISNDNDDYCDVFNDSQINIGKIYRLFWRGRKDKRPSTCK